MGAIYNSDMPDLSAFAAAGGQDDHLARPRRRRRPARQDRRLLSELGRSHGLEELRATNRLFLIPGIDHCGIQPGPGIDLAGFDPLTALETWLETGTAPETLLTTRAAADGPAAWSRPVCAWPQVARYDGTATRTSRRASPARRPDAAAA